MNTITKWGVRLLSVWAFVLAALSLANLLLLTQTVEFISDQYGNQGRVWLIFGFGIIFAVAFGASGYGLWQQKNWGRLLFLWIIVIWFGFNLLALLAPGLIYSNTTPRNTTAVITNGLRLSLALVIPLWYLNRPQIKAVFLQNSLETEDK